MSEKDIPISKYLALHWNDSKVSDVTEKAYRDEFEAGIEDYNSRCKDRGHTTLMFKVENLIC